MNTTSSPAASLPLQLWQHDFPVPSRVMILGSRAVLTLTTPKTGTIRFHRQSIWTSTNHTRECGVASMWKLSTPDRLFVICYDMDTAHKLAQNTGVRTAITATCHPRHPPRPPCHCRRPGDPCPRRNPRFRCHLHLDPPMSLHTHTPKHSGGLHEL